MNPKLTEQMPLTATLPIRVKPSLSLGKLYPSGGRMRANKLRRKAEQAIVERSKKERFCLC
jgi:hypothetical protein